ncbi:hypothetical protein B0O99DRAFT_625576 [Bisporella sp. PMI_857]|nr:hypothetical protein B0O99DRAFT_625576 [Bisporella sp. PMI_857]
MTSENFAISLCTHNDLLEMVRVYQAAWINDLFNNACFPSEKIDPYSEEKYEWIKERQTLAMAKPENRTFKITDLETGRIAAWSRWCYPHVLSPEEKAAREAEEQRKKDSGWSEWPPGANHEICSAKFGAIYAKRKENVDSANDYVVLLLQTDPAYQRKGLAAKLLKHGLALADREGRKVHIEGTPAGHTLYLKLGFRDTDILEVDLTKWGLEGMGRNWIMVRDPQPA